MGKLSHYWAGLKRQPLLYHIVLIAAILLALGVAAHTFMQLGTRHGARRMVPDFAGMTLSDAEHAAHKHGLQLFINDSLYVPAYEGGIVLDQLPGKGIEVKPGRTIYITINSFNQKMVPVPYVAGRSLRQAKNMLELAGLGIEKLVYRPDIATNYVLMQYVDQQQVTSGSKIEAEAGSGVTLYVGVAEGQGTTVMPRLIGLSQREARSRLWEQGLNIGAELFDEGINLLNKKDARVYTQAPGQERTIALGATVDLRFTLSAEKIDKMRAEAEKMAKGLAAERQLRERAEADSLARLELEQALQPQEPLPTEGEDDLFF